MTSPDRIVLPDSGTVLVGAAAESYRAAMVEVTRDESAAFLGLPVKERPHKGYVCWRCGHYTPPTVVVCDCGAPREVGT